MPRRAMRRAVRVIVSLCARSMASILCTMVVKMMRLSRFVTPAKRRKALTVKDRTYYLFVPEIKSERGTDGEHRRADGEYRRAITRVRTCGRPPPLPLMPN